jgi:hypothetical protein
MKGCKFENPLQLNNLVENHEALFVLSKDQTVDDTVDYLNKVNNSFTKIDRLYQVRGGSARLATTITTRISEKYNRNNPTTPSPEQVAMGEVRMATGTFVHSLNEIIIKDIINSVKDLSVNDAITYLDNLEWSTVFNNTKTDLLSKKDEFSSLTLLDKKNANDLNNLEAIFDGAKSLVKQVYSHQRFKNGKLKTEGKPTIFVEQIIIDPVNDIGGTVDFLVMYSDNTAGIYDFKTKIPKKEFLNERGDLITDKFVTEADNERFKMQLASIGKILKERYGVKQIVQNRIVPIQINMGWDKAKSNYNGVISRVVYGFKQSPFLSQLTPLPELTGFKDLDDFLLNIDKKIINYTNKAKEDKTKSTFYKQKIDDLRASKKSILTQHSLDNLIKYTNNLLDNSTQDKLNTMNLDDLRELKDELNALKLLSSATYEYRDFLIKSNNKSLAAIKDDFEDNIKNISIAVNDRLYEVEQVLYNQRLAEAVDKLTGYQITNDLGEFISFYSDGALTNYFNQLSHFENPIFKALRAKLDDAQFKIKKQVKDVIEDIVNKDDALRTWMKVNNKSDQWLVDVLVDKNSDNFHLKLSKEFRDKIKELKANKDVKELSKIYKPNENYEAWYKRELKTKTDYYKQKYTNDKEIKQAIALWEKNNNLEVVNGTVKNENAWLNHLKKGTLVIKPEIEEANYSAEYKYIKSVPALHEYYNTFEKYNKEFRKMLGVDYFELPNNFIPNIRKSNIDRLIDNGIVGGSKDILNNLSAELNVREDDMLFGEIDLETGELKKRIPRFYINKFKSKDGALLIGEKSYDFTKSLIIFSKMAYNYQEMNNIESVVLTMRDFLSEKAESVVKKDNTVIKDLIGGELATKLKGKDLDKIFQSYVDLYLYGVSINPMTESSSGKYEKIILEAKQYFTLKALGLGFIPATGSFLAAKIQTAIEGFKGQSYTASQYRNSMKLLYTDRSKFHALYSFFDPMNVEYDFFSVTTKRTSLGDPTERNKIKKYVNTRLLMRPFSKGDEFLDEIILTSMAQNWYINDDGELKRMKNDEEREQYKDKSVWNNFVYEDGKAYVKNVTPEQSERLIINFRKASQAVQSKIKGMIPEDDKAIWQTQIVGQLLMHFKSWMPGIIKERIGKVKYNDALQAIEMGRVTAFRQELYSEDQLGTIEFMKSIVLPKLVELGKRIVFLGKDSNDTNLKMAYEKWLDSNEIYKNKASFEDFKEAYKSQIKTLVLELRIILAFAGLIALLGSDFDDDGEKFYKEMWLSRKLIAVLKKVEAETGFIYNPKEFAKMIKNPIPMAGVLVDVTNVIANTYDEVIDVTLGEKMPLPFHNPASADSTPFLYYSSKLIPGLNQSSTFFEIFNK